MKVSSISIHCSKFSGNKYPRVTVSGGGMDVVLSVSVDEGSYDKITFFMSESDLINFKNSVVNAVNNYKRNKK